MTSEPVRDPATDHLLTPENCLLALIDFQPVQVRSVTSIDHDLLVANVVRVAETARTFGLPIVLSTVNVATGANEPTIGRLADVLTGIDPIELRLRNYAEADQNEGKPFSSKELRECYRHKKRLRAPGCFSISVCAAARCTEA